MAPRTLVVATNNKHKLDEIRAILGPSWVVRGASDVAPGISWDETGDTFFENAGIKIAALRPYSDDYILADDSGLCVDVLDGGPGVRSSSYGGEEGNHDRNVARLLKELANVPEDKRGAHFYCLLRLSMPDGGEQIFEGRCPGRIAMTRSGTGGFGYDPVFIPDGDSRSMAELTENEKNAISHRGRAMSAFMRECR